MYFLWQGISAHTLLLDANQLPPNPPYWQQPVSLLTLHQGSPTFFSVCVGTFGILKQGAAGHIHKVAATGHAANHKMAAQEAEPHAQKDRGRSPSAGDKRSHF